MPGRRAGRARLEWGAGPRYALKTVEKPTYSSNDVQAILGRALEQQRVHGEGELSYEELVAIGRDVGLSEQAIAAAARQHESEGELDAELARRLSKERRGFLSHVATFVIINAFLMIMNLASGGPLWSFWPLFGWGMGLAFHLLSVALPNRERMREKAQASLLRRRRDDDKRREKTAKREQKERERFERDARRQALEQNAHRIKRAVEERLSEAVADLANRLEGPAQNPPPAKSRVADARPRSRVEPTGQTRWNDAYEEAEAELHEAERRRGARFLARVTDRPSAGSSATRRTFKSDVGRAREALSAALC